MTIASMTGIIRSRVWPAVAVLAVATSTLAWPDRAAETWSVGVPIVNYWAGPGWPAWNWPPDRYMPLTRSNAQQMVDVGINLVWASTQKEMDIAQKYGLRVMWGRTYSDPYATFIAKVSAIRRHPALYSYFLYDEPPAGQFSSLAQFVAGVRALDPDRLAYINLFGVAPTNVLGASSYRAYLHQFVSTVQPALLSYDHYQFYTWGVQGDYLENLEQVSQEAKSAGRPFMNIVQLSSWGPGVLIPTSNEVRYLIYSTLAYGAQGISYYDWGYPGDEGGIINPTNGRPYPVCDTLKAAHREFVTIAEQYQKLNWIGTYLKGYNPLHRPPGTIVLPHNAPFDIASVGNTMYYTNLAPVKGVLFGLFDAEGNTVTDATFALIANPDYATNKTYTVTGPGNLSVFDGTARRWAATGSNSATVKLAPGGGVLVGLTSSITDSNPPVATRAYSFIPRFGAWITFNEPVDISRATFGINGNSVVTNAVPLYDNKSVWLQVSNGLPSPRFIVSYTNVMDWTGNAATNSVMGVNEGYIMTDISPALPGQLTAFSPTNFTIVAQGFLAQGRTHDSFPFVYKAMTGNFDLRLQIVDIRCDSNSASWGIMIRNSTHSDSPALYVGARKAGIASWLVQDRTAPTAAMNTIAMPSRSTNAEPPNTWVRLQRIGHRLNSYGSSNGINWDLLATVTNLPLTDTQLVGICGSSADKSQASTVQYANFGPTFPVLNPNHRGQREN